MVVRAERHRASGSHGEAHAFAAFPGVDGAYQSGVLAGPVTVAVEASIVHRVRQACARYRVRERSLLLGAHLYALCRIYGTRHSASHVIAECNAPGAAGDLSRAELYRFEWTADLTWRQLIEQVETTSHESCSTSSEAGGARVLFAYRCEDVEPWVSGHSTDCATVVVSLSEGSGQALKLTMSIVGALLPEEQLQYYCECYRHLLAHVSEHVDDPISKDNFHSPAMKRELLDAFRGREASIADMQSLPQVVQSNASYRAERTAFVCGERKVSFAELGDKVARLAAGLVAQGISRGDKVAIYSYRDIEWAIMQVACMAMGAVYVPVDPAFPRERIRHMLMQAEVKLVATTENAGNAVLTELCMEQQIRMAKYSQLLAERALDWWSVCNAFCRDDVAYIQFTSGTTGLPKGAMIEHLGMLNHIAAKMDVMTLTAEDVIAQTASQCFDVSIWQLLTGLYTGSTTVIYPDEKVWNMVEYLEYTRQQAVTVLEVVPSYLALLFGVMDASRSRFLERLRYLMVTGERVTLGQLRRWFAFYPEIPVVNAYGPTEASDDITHLVLDRSFDGTRVPIGFPIRNASIYILDEDLSVLPRGSLGEICVAGRCVGRGYINRPEETARSFTVDPFQPGAVRMYRTGDFGRGLPNGSIEYWGRCDEQVKVLGVRIELTEIEQQLSVIDALGDVAVVVRDGKLICYYTSRTREPVNGQIIKSQLKTVLPGHSIPSKFIRIDQMPLGATGKVDKARLP